MTMGPRTDDDWMRVAPDNGNLKEVVPGRDEARVDPSQRVVLREPPPPCPDQRYHQIIIKKVERL